MLLASCLLIALRNPDPAFDPGPNPLLMKHPTVNATTVVFSYAGDLWSVPRSGGEARRLTASVGTENFPYFSPDGTQIAFTGQYDGNVDVYVMPAEGGGKTLAVSRYPIDGKTVTLPLASIIPQNGFWSANKADAGGLLFECQTAMCFVSYFGYRANGTPAWYVSGGQIMPDGAGYDGNLQEVSGGPTFTTPGGKLGSIDRGRISLRFSSQSSGSLTLGTNPAIPITRTTGY
jgi:hypothetical protein